MFTSIARSPEPTPHFFFRELNTLINKKDLTDRDLAVIRTADQVFKMTYHIPESYRKDFENCEVILAQLKARGNLNRCEHYFARILLAAMCSSAVTLILAIINPPEVS